MPLGIQASNYRQPRGDALPLLMDLARKPSLLHADEVKAATPAESLALLLGPARGTNKPHPFYVADPAQRGGGDLPPEPRRQPAAVGPARIRELLPGPTERHGRTRVGAGDREVAGAFVAWPQGTTENLEALG